MRKRRIDKREWEKKIIMENFLKIDKRMPSHSKFFGIYGGEKLSVKSTNDLANIYSKIEDISKSIRREEKEEGSNAH